MDDDEDGSDTPTTTRVRLPLPQPERREGNFWSLLKQCVGKELSKITMPVEWNEPLSLLQRLSETIRWGSLLRVASQVQDPADRLGWVAAFAVSSLAHNDKRMGKPFNPLLGETFHFRTGDVRIFLEQVGHHPPISAFHADNPDGDFVFHGSTHPKLKFRGKSIEVEPKGTLTVRFPKMDDETYTWNNVNCIIHNIILGSLSMEHVGTMEITNHSTKQRCLLTFRSGQESLHSVVGFIVEQSDQTKVKFIYGSWVSFLCSVDIQNFEDYFNVKADKINSRASNLPPKHKTLELCSIPGSCVLWQDDLRPQDSEKYYNFTTFTMGLNEPAVGRSMSTDSRNRPDVRALENGDLEVAAQEKIRLEMKQREYRKPFKNKKESEWWTPAWFVSEKNKFTEADDWKYIGGAWDKENLENNGNLNIF